MRKRGSMIEPADSATGRVDARLGTMLALARDVQVR